MFRFIIDLFRAIGNVFKEYLDFFVAGMGVVVTLQFSAILDDAFEMNSISIGMRVLILHLFILFTIALAWLKTKYEKKRRDFEERYENSNRRSGKVQPVSLTGT